MGAKWLLSKFQGSVEWTFLILQRIQNYDDKCITDMIHIGVPPLLLAEDEKIKNKKPIVKKE